MQLRKVREFYTGDTFIMSAFQLLFIFHALSVQFRLHFCAFICQFVYKSSLEDALNRQCITNTKRTFRLDSTRTVCKGNTAEGRSSELQAKESFGVKSSNQDQKDVIFSIGMLHSFIWETIVRKNSGFVLIYEEMDDGFYFD